MRLAALSCLVALGLVGAAGCGPTVDLSKALQIVDVQSGYQDLGVVNAKTKMVPTATFHVKNVGATAIDGFQLSASFWIVGDDGMKDDLTLPQSVAKDLAPGATSEAITVTAQFGYTLDVPRAEAFQNSVFRDFVIKLTGKIGGKIAKIGEINVDRKIFSKN